MRKLPLLALVLSPFLACGEEEGRTKVRLLYSFERSKETAELLKKSEHIDIATVQDYGVTEGKNCARVTAKRGVAWALFTLGERAIRNWSDFDYFAMDIHIEDAHPYGITFELWDRRSHNYATRCTYEHFRVHPGKQTALFHIARAKRNNKEGRDWQELEPKDKIDLDGLKTVKIFLTPRKDRNAVFWIDNLRLMQEDAAKPKMRVKLPEGAIAFDFGSAGAVVPGFKGVTHETRFPEGKGCGFASTEGLAEAGKGWPDLLTGTYVWSPKSGRFQFRARAPNGEYRVWLSAGKVIRPGMPNRRFLLRINGKTICDETPSLEEFCSEKYLYRFMWTQYSERPHALWRSYVNRMYPAFTGTVEVTGGEVTVAAQNHLLSALILLPAGKEASFQKMARDIRKRRIEAFEKTYYTPPQTKPKKRPGDGDFVLYVPDHWRKIMPWTGPSEEERKRIGIRAAGAPGQRVVMRIAVVPFADLGKCSLELADLTGPGTIPASKIEGYWANYRSDGSSVGEMALMPSLTLDVEKGITHCFRLCMKIPEDATAGIYRGAFTFRPGRRKGLSKLLWGFRKPVPVELEVYPFTLERTLPVSYGMYYGSRRSPGFPEAVKRAKLKEQLEWMREIGFTAVPVGCPRVTGVDLRSWRVSLRFDETFYELAREVGMAALPEQELMASSLGIGRAIGRRLPGSRGAKVDQDPGLELRQPGFRELCADAYRQYKKFLDRMALPVAVEVVDEPREMPNPWNRNLADTIAYADMLHAAGIRTFVTPMGDKGAGKDYTVMVDHMDVISTHAGAGSKRFMRKTLEKGKTLWLYNTGMDRFSWGFYNWRVGSQGRWEWHFCWSEGGAVGGYPGQEWYNPFTSLHGFAPNAPYSKYRGGMLFQSCYLDVSEGVTDYAYIYTLEKAIETNERAGRNARAVRSARDFLAALKAVVPEFPKVKGIASEADGALVGMGLEDEARKMCDRWRRQIAVYLKQLRR